MYSFIHWKSERTASCPGCYGQVFSYGRTSPYCLSLICSWLPSNSKLLTLLSLFVWAGSVICTTENGSAAEFVWLFQLWRGAFNESRRNPFVLLSQRRRSLGRCFLHPRSWRQEWAELEPTQNPEVFLAKMAQEGIGLRKSPLIDFWLSVKDCTNIEQRLHEYTWLCSRLPVPSHKLCEWGEQWSAYGPGSSHMIHIFDKTIHLFYNTDFHLNLKAPRNFCRSLNGWFDCQRGTSDILGLQLAPATGDWRMSWQPGTDLQSGEARPEL